MKINFKQLGQHCKNLPDIFLINGDDPWLRKTAREQVLQAAKAQGFDQIKRIHAEPKINWDEFYYSLQAQGLFTEKNFIDLYIPKANFDKEGLAALKDFIELASPDVKLLITTDYLNKAAQNKAWHKLVDQHGVVLTLWPLQPQELQSWISAQAAKHQITLDRPSIDMVIDLTQGNMLATEQALIKLSLVYPNSQLDLKQTTAALTDSAKFSIYDLVSVSMLGQRQQAIRILQYLQEEGVASNLVLWALNQDVSQLYSLLLKRQAGESVQQILQSVWRNKQPMLRAALQRLNLKRVQRLIALAQTIDQAIKTSGGPAWLLLEQYCLLLTG